MAELRFDGKVVLITGAGRGVGRAHALSFAARGASIVVADHGVALDGSGHSNSPADDVVSEIQAAGGQAVACHESVSDEKGAAAMVQAALDSFGRLDTVINNAGINGPELFENHTADEFRRMTEVHYLGTVFVSRAAWGHFMHNGGGRIVNTISEGPLGIHEMMTAYGGAKGGVIGFTLALAAEGPKYGISVNGLSPRVSTRMSSPEVMSHVYGRPLESFAQLPNIFPPELCSPAAIYLAHPSCPLNGVMLACGGGQVLRIAVMQNQGYSTENLAAEDIAQNVDKVINMANAVNIGVGIQNLRSHHS
ncbi:NAD(P)-dependent dehydrogenase, short-chain alcohol dehydrogenase family [Sphingomonas sp. YR710]|jgi:NAD(P)-dependent dehydrogenase (short-subunit alcohol dehydrogenase family)|uniref:SDR family NAD(P)-dependent oxidoreductase n=1 Tax=Sphingomonas sp. YR710 TaxID=1882773 RepID=UPI00088B66A8|nr:SDR family NAD(P)-dependent oxidoreductase [Sphingomonas sp. YR710]SDD83095.1 NAD(P)-dependent dehydrogenase, short-chain alcohol dehydrogenase family [Sphingomonas sp. YR710]